MLEGAVNRGIRVEIMYLWVRVLTTWEGKNKATAIVVVTM